MAKNITKTKNSTEIFPKRKIVISLFMCVFMFFLPFISYMHKEKITDFISKFYSSKNGYITDWFLYQKELCVILFAIALIIFFILEFVLVNRPYKNIPLKQKNMRIALILCGIYAFFLILSGIFSEHKEVVLMGMVKHYEGLLGVLSYLIIFIAAMNYFNHTHALNFLSYTIIFLTGFAGILAVFEYFGYPIVGTSFMAHLMAPASDYASAKGLHSTSSNVHITFFNSNYFGSFCGLLFPITLCFSIEMKNKVIKVIGVVSTVLIAFGAVVSNSSGGLYSVIICLVIIAVIYTIYFFRKLINKKIALVSVTISAVVLILGTVLLYNISDTFAARLKSVVSNGASQTDKEAFNASHFVLKDLDAIGSHLYLYDINDNKIDIECVTDAVGGRSVKYFDTNGNKLDTTIVDGFETFSDERYANCKFQFKNGEKLYCNLGYSANLVFKFENNTFKPFVHGSYTMDKINKYNGPSIFKNNLNFATGRGFIWGSTISTLKDCIIIGHGNGNFLEYFPQYDYVSILEVYQTPAIIVNKAHNWYLGIACDSGIISLIAVLALLFVIIWRGIKSCIIKPKNDNYLHLRLGLFIGVIAFMLVSIVNDSYVCVSPIFWFIFGIAWYVLSDNEIINTDKVKIISKTI